MSRSLPDRTAMVKVNSVHRRDDDALSAVNKVHHDLQTVRFEMAKARMGEAIGAAVGGAPLKAFGPKALMSELISGSKVPDYLAQIAANDQARRRFALSLLENDPAVRRRTVIDIDEEKVG